MKRITLPIALCAFLAGCGPSESLKKASESLKEEAYRAGWNSIFNEKCNGISQPLMVPKKYDDSMGSGEVMVYYRSGIIDAYRNPDLCK